MPETNKVETNQAMQFDAIQIGLASPEKIREWSHVPAPYHNLQENAYPQTLHSGSCRSLHDQPPKIAIP